MRLSFLLPLYFLLFLCSGCSKNYQMARHGINPVIEQSDIISAVDSQKTIVHALMADADTKDNLYDATLYGFNYVDDQCRVYFSQLFSAEKDLQAVKSGASALGQTTTAILSVTGASRLSMGVVAQAFGLTSSLLDANGSSFLYRLPAAPTKEFVGNMQTAYRQTVGLRKGELTESEVYYHVQRYLDLCLPATIEGQITKYIGAAQAFPENVSKSTSGAFNIAVESNQAVPRRIQILSNSRTVIDPQPPRTATTKPKNAQGRVEEAIPLSMLVAIQKALCVPADGDWGKSGSTTRTRIRDYLSQIDATRLNKEFPDQVNDWGGIQLRELVDDKNKKCGVAAIGGG